MGGNSWWAVQIAVDQRPGEGWEGVGREGGREGGGGAAFEGLTEDQQLTRCRRRLSPRALSPSPLHHPLCTAVPVWLPGVVQVRVGERGLVGGGGVGVDFVLSKIFWGDLTAIYVHVQPKSDRL